MNFKNTLRGEIDEKLSSITHKTQKKLSESLTRNLISSTIWKESKEIFLYISFKSEVETDQIILEGKKSGKSIFAPRINNKNMKFYRIDNINSEDLIKNSYGILEPPSGLKEAFPIKSSLMLIPGVAFNLKGERLGRGGGFYDRYLKEFPDIIKTGTTFEIQICDNLPTDDWDQNMDYLLTDKKLYKIGVNSGTN